MQSDNMCDLKCIDVLSMYRNFWICCWPLAAATHSSDSLRFIGIKGRAALFKLHTPTNAVAYNWVMYTQNEINVQHTCIKVQLTDCMI